MPSILFINRVYPLDAGATGRVLEHAARGLFNAGWDVTVLATAGCRETLGEEWRDGIRVIRVGSLFSNKNLITRTLGFAMMIPRLLLKALLLYRHDLLVTMTDPPMLAIIGPLIQWAKGSRLIHWSQDLYPEVAEECGVLRKGGAFANILRNLSTWSLRSYDLTLAVGRCMSDRLLARGIDAASIRVMPNAGIEVGILPVPRGKSACRVAHGISNEFVIMYSGNMGRAHEFDTVIGAARLLQERGEHHVLFLFVGEGPEEIPLRDAVTRLDLRNIRFIPSQPAANLSDSLGMGDLHLVTMKKGMSGLVVPSKFYGVMAAARPILFVGSSESEVARVILEKRMGEVIAPGDSEKLVAVILSYQKHPIQIDEEGLRAQAFVQNEDFLPIMVQEAHRISLRHKML